MAPGPQHSQRDGAGGAGPERGWPFLVERSTPQTVRATFSRMSITIDTVGACLAHRYEVRAYCRCGHWARIDLAAVALAKGEGLTLDKLWTSLRCTKCGGRRVSAQLVPIWEPDPARG